ncbi:MAG: DUF4344 domain-containing metallopeptidase [Rubricoccaceae bacterium]
MRLLCFAAAVCTVLGTGCSSSSPAATPDLDRVLADVPRPTASPSEPLAFSGSSAAPDPGEGRFVAVTERERGPGGLIGPLALQTVGAIVRMSNEVNATVGLPKDIRVESGACGAVNAFYSPSEERVVLCDELVTAMDTWFAELELDAETAYAYKTGALEFIVGHEMGHALVHLLELPVLGRNEDAADLLAVYFALTGDDPARAAGGMMFFVGSILNRPEDYEPAYAGVHALDEQRVATIACHLFGADPEANIGLVNAGILPESRARRCVGEYQTAVRDIERQLADHRRE